MSNLLSVCMIVKDEEDVIDRCLSSVSKLADEIIIIDTGSTDRTKEIAAQYTEHVYDYVWSNDFSAARNESLTYATSQWVLVLDADEYIEPKEIPAIREFLYKEIPLSSTIYGISVVSFLGDSIRTGKLTEATVSRLLPNHFGIKFHRPIHEQLCSNEGLPLLTKKADIHVYHTGYLQTTMIKKDKSTRNKQIFAQLKSKSGFSAYDYFTIGNEYSVQREYKKALYYYEKSYKKSSPTTNWHYICVFEVINNYLRQDRVHEAWELLEKESAGKKHYPDYHCMQGTIYDHFGLFELAKTSFKAAIASSEALAVDNDIFWLVSPSLALETPLDKLISIAMREHNIKDTTYFLTKKIQSDPSDFTSLVHLLELTLNYEGEEAVKKFIDLLFARPQMVDYYLLFKVFLTLGQSSLAEKYYHLISNKEHFAPHDLIRFAILSDDQVTLNNVLNRSELDLLNIEMLKALGLVYTVSNIKVDISSYSEQEAENEEYSSDSLEAARFYIDLINNQISDEWIENNKLRIFELLTDLFQLCKFDIFDKYINQFSHPVIIDLLANYFYSKHKYDIAISYYNNLIDSNQLSLLSYINLATLHVNDQLYDDAIPFYEEATKESVDPRQLYIQLLTYCNDEAKKSAYRKQLFDRYPGYRKLSFLQQL